MAIPYPLGCQCKVYSLGSILYTDINALAVAASVTATLDTTGIPTGYVIGGVWLNCKDAFVSAGATDIFPDNAGNFLETTVGTNPIYGGVLTYTALLQTTGQKIHVYPSDSIGGVDNVTEVAVDSYVGGIDATFIFAGGANNPQDYTSGELEVLIELKKSPI